MTGQARQSRDRHSLRRRQEKDTRNFYSLIRAKSSSPKTISVPFGIGAGTGSGSGGFLKTSGDTMIGPFAMFPKVQTIAAGVIDVSSSTGQYTSRLIVATEGAAATDDIDTITGAAHAGQLLNIQSVETQTITLKHNVDNFYSYTGADVSFTGNIVLVFNSINNKWIEWTPAGGGSGSGVQLGDNPIWTGNHTHTGTTHAINCAQISLGDSTFDNVFLLAGTFQPAINNTHSLGISGKSFSQVWTKIISDTVSVNITSPTLTIQSATINLGDGTGDTVNLLAGKILPAINNTHALGESGKSFSELWVKIINDGTSVNITAPTTTIQSAAINIGDSTGDVVSILGRIGYHIVPSSDNSRDLGTASLEWRNLYVDGTAELDTVNVDGTITCIGITSLSGSLTSITSATILLGDSTADNLSILARINSDVDPDAADTYDLGNNTLPWRNVFNQRTNVIQDYFAAGFAPSDIAGWAQIFVRDSGAGKMQLRVKFGSTTSQLILEET